MEGRVAARQLTAVLSEGGMATRWLPLSRRLDWVEAVLHRPWSATPFAQFLAETPWLVLDAPEAVMQALRAHLQHQHLLQETLFLPAYLCSPLTTDPLSAVSPQQLEAWRMTYEELQKDLDIAARWLPCTLTAQIT